MIWSLALWPLLAGIALWAAGTRLRGRETVAALLAMALTLVLGLVAGGDPAGFAWAPDLTLRAELAPVSAAMAALVPLIGLAVILFAGGHEDRDGLPRLLAGLLVFTGAMELVVIAGDLLTLLIGWELMGAASWALIGHRWRDAAAMPSGAYAFVMTRAGDLGLFLALFACYAGTGSLDYAALGALQGGPLALAAFGILVAAAAKAGQVPFSPWLFRAMAGPTSISAYLHSSTMVAAGAFLLVRLHPQLASAPGWGGAVIAVGLATAIGGGITALRQTHAKKVLAASTSAQLGLMFAAVGAGWPAVAMVHLIAHAALKAPLFFAAGIAHDRAGTFDLRRMSLGRALPGVAVLTAIAALALAGVPPLGAAWSKEEIAAALGHASPWLLVATIVAGGLSAAYATRFAALGFGPGAPDEGATRPASAEIAALALPALATLALSALWLPSVHDAAMARLGGALPPSGGTVELAASLVVIALGVLAGLAMARDPRDREGADWLGLPGLIDAVIVRPAGRVAKGSARLDDLVLDGLPRSAAVLGRIVAGSLARADDNGIDGQDRGGRGAVALVVRLSRDAADLSGRPGEALADLIPAGTGRLAGMAGADLRRSQTGLAHHYYAYLVAGFALGAFILILGA